MHCQVISFSGAELLAAHNASYKLWAQIDLTLNGTYVYRGYYWALQPMFLSDFCIADPTDFQDFWIMYQEGYVHDKSKQKFSIRLAVCAPVDNVGQRNFDSVFAGKETVEIA